MMGTFILLLFLTGTLLEAKPVPENESFDDEINNSDYSYTTYSSSSGYKGYHYTGGGLFMLAAIVLIVRLCLICNRRNWCTPTSRSIIIVQHETRPIDDVIISRQRPQRSNSKEDLTGNAEPPAVDPPPPYENYGGNVHGNSAAK